MKNCYKTAQILTPESKIDTIVNLEWKEIMAQNKFLDNHVVTKPVVNVASKIIRLYGESIRLYKEKQ